MNFHRTRRDLPGRFNEIDLLKREWEATVGTLSGLQVPPFEVLIHPSSSCNLSCNWCIGDHVPIKSAFTILEAAKQFSRLPDTLTDPTAMARLIAGILAYRKVVDIPGLPAYEASIKAVSFSGLIGEPLIAKSSVLQAMESLTEARKRVGLFTNATLMGQDTWAGLCKIAYVHISLDAATPQTYATLKASGRQIGVEFFRRAISNTGGLVETRARCSSSLLTINASFILYPENFREVYEAARLLRNIGVGALRIKQDNSARRLLSADDQVIAGELLQKIEEDLCDSTFTLIKVHHLGDAEEMQRVAPVCSISDMMAAVGSDGHLYPCNYHPRPNGWTYGSAVESTFEEVWEGRTRARTKEQLPKICPAVCDPYKNRANRLLADAREVFHTAGMSGLERFRQEAVEAIDG